MSDKLIVSVSPHIYSGESSAKIMWMVTLSLLPAGIAGIVIFGLTSLWIILISVVCAILTEAIIQKLRRTEITIFDGSAALTGLLLAFCLPPSVPLWLVAVGAFVAIAIGKQAFGGLGQNIFNPALVGRAFLLAAWPTYMTTWRLPHQALDGVTGATPLANNFIGVTLRDLLLGNRSGCIGEIHIIALLAGALFLLVLGYITWHIPFSFIATVGIFTWIFGGENFFNGQWLLHILSGGLILGAFFMATDYVTSPLTNKGKLIFGFGCGLFTSIIRLWGGYPEGVCYAILLMNAATPLIDRYTKLRRFGVK
ncbi:MAG: RnfABCDGE type electron transport complex subunit D [Candidatus Omnitrophica bacterium]|nr:RnfABCDGE type electron transport complex subunit D [Candidatus Omnitrophota bacterium]